MSKFGVGVGDDFPVDDGRGNEPGRDQAQPQDDRAEFEEWKRRRDAHRAQREEWRRQREEWRERKRAFKERVRQAARETFGEGYDDRYRDEWRSGGRRHRGGFPFLVWPAVGLLIPVLIVATFIAIIAAVFKSPFVFLGLVILAVVFFAHRHHHHDHRGYYDRGYDFDLKPRPNNNGGTIVTPPPAPPAAPAGK
ncbi:MAG TPA: hypothetical protein VIM56_16115 [Rhizomicrobium sp.]